MNGDIILYTTSAITFKQKFYYLMNLLISKQAETRLEALFYIIIFYLQIISSFFSEKLGVFSEKNGKSDLILIYIKKIIRVKDLFSHYYNYFTVLRIIFYILIPVCILHFIISCYFTKRTSFYSYNNMIINFYINCFLYILYNILCDIFLSGFCLGKGDKNENFENISCEKDLSVFSIIIKLLYTILILVLYIFINIYYTDSFYLTDSFLSKMSCNYDSYWGINCLIISLLSVQVKFLTKEAFLIYNLIMSFILLIYFIHHYLYYDKYMNHITGIFHLLYFWTSIFCLIFAYIDFKEKGIVYIITIIIVSFFYINIQHRIESLILLETPIHKLNNKYYLLHYIRKFSDIVSGIEKKPQYKSILSGLIRMHEIECPIPNCPIKNKDKEKILFYLPLTNTWNNPLKKENEDEVFLKNFLILSLNFLFVHNKFTVDMYINLSLYYLKIIGNYCQAIFLYKKASKNIATLREHFSYIRLSIFIQKVLKEKVKPPNELCPDLENLDVSMYYKYDKISKNLLDEINKDVNLSLEFWKSFRAPLREASKTVNFDNIFELTDKIGKTKANVERLWNKLINIYGGINDYFDLYVEYVEQINDDDLKKRDLEAYRRKNESFGDHMNNNFYSMLFNKETGIIIANGDKGSEGLIELCNKEIENIFKYKAFELKGVNLSILMPNLFAKVHSDYVKKYFKIGEKKILDKPDFKTFGLDNNNSVMKLKLAIKLFPILNEKVYFVGMINKENIDDIILLDSKFNIQGMSSKIMKILNIRNKSLFQSNEIPFYVICKKFVNFYHIFFQGKKKGELSEKQYNIEDKKEREDLHENIEINENVELEYEIKLPQFLIDYSEKTIKKGEQNAVSMIQFRKENNDIQNDIISEDDEHDPLLNEQSNIKSKMQKTTYLSIKMPEPTKLETQTPDDVTSSELDSSSDIKENNKKISDEEKMYNYLMEQYKSLFNEGKINELEKLIDNINKSSNSIEYKFNFTFDKYKYGDKETAYIVRCIDNKNDIGKSSEESMIELDSKIARYRKEKSDSIKPLYEILIQEKEDIELLPEKFPKLSSENKNFQKLLEKCKQIINEMSKIHGQKKVEIFDDENSSQTSQSGYDSGLVKKNRIEEIRSNLLTNISSFYTLKYIQLNLFLMGLCTLIFSIIFILLFSRLNTNLNNSSNLNIDLFRTVLGVSKIMGVIISLRTIFNKEVFSLYDNKLKSDFIFNDYFTHGQNLSIYYNETLSLISLIYARTFKCFSNIESEIPSYLNNEQLIDIYWNKMNISYINKDYIDFSHRSYEDSFPMAVNQLLSNSIVFAETEYFNNILNTTINETNYISIQKYFNYMTYLIIENGYDHVLPNQLEKLNQIPKILSKVNSSRTNIIVTLVCIFITIMISLCVLCSFFIIITKQSMSDGMEKVSKIKLERIEEIIKRFKVFNNYLNKFRERDYRNDTDNKEEMRNVEVSVINQGEKNKYRDNNANNNNNNLGFNMDSKKYLPLTKLKFSFLHIFIIFIIIIISVALILSNTLTMVSSTNQMLLVQVYIFGKLVHTTISTIEVKCYMSYCQNETNINFTLLDDPDLITEVIKGVNYFPKINDYYNNKFLLNACGSIYDNEKSPLYEKCMKDNLVISANNTDNLLKLIDDWIDNIHKEEDINNDDRRDLFNTNYFYEIEYMFYKYIFNVSAYFQSAAREDLKDYLHIKTVELYVIGILMGIFTIFFCFFFGICFIKELIHHLSVSRIILKIIPTSVIINTQELETWIENKY